jgi:hypothetical protein
VLTSVRRATLTATLVLLVARPVIAQQTPQCGCRSGTPPSITVPQGTPSTDPGSNGATDGSDSDHSWVALLPLGPLAAILAHRSGAALAPVSGEVGEPPSIRELRASEDFHANVDSLSRGMRAPNTATPLPTVAVFALTLGAAGGMLLRRRSA